MGKLPDHWEEVPAETRSYDDGRDYSKPMYVRKDGYARIYHNEVSGSGDEQYEYAIVFADGDGECAPTLESAIQLCDSHIEENLNSFLLIEKPHRQLY